MQEKSIKVKAMKDEIPYFGAGSLVVLSHAFPVKAEIYDIRTKSDSYIDQLLDKIIYSQSRNTQKEELPEKRKQPETKNRFCKFLGSRLYRPSFLLRSESFSDTFAFQPQTILFVRSGQLLRIKEKLSTMPELIVIAKDAPGDFRGVFAEMKSQETTLMWKE